MPYELHAVIVSKDVPLKSAKKMAADIIKKDSRKFYRSTEESYRFRNIPKTKFNPKTFRSKIVNENVTLVFGDKVKK